MEAVPTLPVRLSDERRDRLRSALGVAVLHALIGWAFLSGLGAAPLAPLPDALKLFSPIEAPPPPPRAEPARPDKAQKVRKARPKDAEGSASPANRRNTPTEIVAPPPEIRIPVPPPLPAAPAAGQGSAPAAGAAAVVGPGTGAGGVGTGLGSGTQGNGTGGGGGGGGRGTPARWIAGRITDDDYPDRAYEARFTGTVYIRFVVARDGRVRDCAVTRSSGHRELDETTCRLILRRFRYRPARDAEGRPVEAVIRGVQEWDVAPEPPVREVEGDIPD